MCRNPCEERLEKALVDGDGEAIAKHGQANQAIIGLPDDASWNDPARFVLYDEDEPGVHRTLMAQTRLGEDSIVAIPLWPEDGFGPEATPDFATGQSVVPAGRESFAQGSGQETQSVGSAGRLEEIVALAQLFSAEC